jgi:multidrug transporter EmrE-like cation transporter
MNKIERLFWYLLVSVSPAIPIIVVKKYVHKSDYRLLIGAIVASAVMIFSYIKILKDKDNNISLLYPFLKIITAIIVVLVGIIFYEEKITFWNICGIILGGIAILLLCNK